MAARETTCRHPDNHHRVQIVVSSSFGFARRSYVVSRRCNAKNGSAVVSLSLSLSLLARYRWTAVSLSIRSFGAAAMNATFPPTRLVAAVRLAGTLVLFSRRPPSKRRLPECVLGAAPSLYATLCRLFVEAHVD